jgi:hypothetical protein
MLHPHLSSPILFHPPTQGEGREIEALVEVEMLAMTAGPSRQ